ncbi:MAG: tetratricopeptide repeat protein [Deltaproteobacteria bacterium]|jgi:tetratricopeptide (TPR) repeat protein|nr:tetratricopeptide repeat protein [Deltaproteobacteria bacterium]
MAKQVSIKKLVKEQDAFFSTTDKIYNFYQDHTKQILIAAICVVVVIVAIISILSYRESQSNKSSEAYFSAKEAYNPQKTLENMEKVRADWKGTPADRAAAYAMVQSYVELQKYNEARELLRNLYSTLPKGEESLKLLINNYLGSLSEELGDNEAAMGYYQEASKLAEQTKAPLQVSVPFRAELLNSLARVYTALGRTDDARNTFVLLSGSFPGTLEGYMSTLKLKEISKAQGPAASSSQGPTAPAESATPTESPAAAPSDSQESSPDAAGSEPATSAAP